MAENIQEDPFDSVTVDYSPGGASVVYWEMEPDYNPDHPVNYTLQWARSGDDNWTDVVTVTDTFWVTDDTQRSFSALRRGHYRVQAVDDASRTHTSAPSQIPSTWDKRDLNMANELRRRELKMYSKVGMKCWVLYRRHWGNKCTNCASPTTGQARDPQCQECYGTGYVGGYYRPYATRLMVIGSGQKITTKIGTTIGRSAQVRMCPQFPVNGKDVIVLKGEGRRYVVDEVTIEAQWKGFPLVLHPKVSYLDPTDVIYDVQWDGTSDLDEASNEDWSEIESI